MFPTALMPRMKLIVAVPVNSSVVMVFASQTSKNVMEPMTVLMDLMSVQNVNVAQMSSSAKMVLVSQVQGSAMAMQSAWMDLMNKTVVLHRVALLMSSSVTLETVFPLELFVMGLLTATMARMKLTALERPAPVLLMNLRVAMERVSMTVQNVMVAMIVLTDQMSWSVSQTDLVKTMNSLVVMVHVCL